MTTEEKHEKFRKIAAARTNKILSMIKLLGNCSNRATYAYTDSEVKQMFDALTHELETAKSRYKNNGSAGKKFEFK